LYGTLWQAKGTEAFLCARKKHSRRDTGIKKGDIKIKYGISPFNTIYCDQRRS
jgi:hypothetical protein